MAIKQALAVQVMETATNGKVAVASLSEVTNGWVALVINGSEKKVVCVTQGECPLSAMWAVESSCVQGGLQVDIMALNANNAAVIRRFVKWAAPSACGTKGTSIGFSDWVGAAGGCVAPLFAKKQVKPVLAEYSAADSGLLKRNFLEAVDAATWGVFETGYKEGYGANAEGLKSEEDIVKALLYGYSMIGLDCSEKINLQIEKMSDDDVAARYNDFPQEFRDAMQGSYLEANFQVGNEVIHFEPEQLRRIVLEYGEAIMHAQFIYNSYLKNTPWEIDFELLVSKAGKLLSPQEHYLIANELQRNGIKFTSLALNALEEAQALQDDLPVHAAIAETFDYRLSFLQADLALQNLGAVAKALKGKVHFKLSSVLWLAAWETLIEAEPELAQELRTYAGLPGATPADLVPQSEIGKAYALSYQILLAPEAGNFAPQVKAALATNQAAYSERISVLVGSYLRTL